MEVRLTPELEKKLNDLAAQTGRAADELVEDAMTGYLDELAGLRGMLGSRYDDLKAAASSLSTMRKPSLASAREAGTGATVPHERFCFPPGSVQRPN